ncbi:MAG: acyl-CoA dehydrogenase family protein [Anaerolineae bacterium]
MIDFTLSERQQQQLQMMESVATSMMRPVARHFDENEHEKPWDFINATWEFTKMQVGANLKAAHKRAAAVEAGEPGENGGQRPKTTFVDYCCAVEMMAWGDVAMYLCIPNPGLGGTAVEAVGTLEQKERFLRRFTEGEPKWGAMAITEAHAGSDTAAIRTTARLDPDSNEWVLNGEKIFCTSGLMAGQESDGFIVVWATVDPSAGRAGIKSFIVEANTPGMTITKVEDKLGIRASDTASIKFEDCRIPYDNILGSAEVQDRKKRKGFKGVMRTFDASRPIVAASAIGVGRAALEFTKEKLAEAGVEIRYGLPRHQLTALERDVMEMEAQLQAAWLLTLRAAWMADQKQANPLEASMAKVKAGRATTIVTQKAVELLGPLGYSRKFLVEKWMRDAKISDLYEGTGQINTLIVARRILGYNRAQLK